MEDLLGLPKGSVKQGGAPKFFDCIKSEIIPFIDKNYKTNTDRGISGHSLGGLFTAYCLVNSDGYFTRFDINSPALEWDNEKMLNQAATHFSANEIWDIPTTNVFISVGEKEEASYVPRMVKFSNYLEDRKYDNINLKWQIFEEESHLSVIPASISKTLSTLYGKN